MTFHEAIGALVENDRFIFDLQTEFIGFNHCYALDALERIADVLTAHAQDCEKRVEKAYDDAYDLHCSCDE